MTPEPGNKIRDPELFPILVTKRRLVTNGERLIEDYLRITLK